MISANHDKVYGFKPIVKLLYQLLLFLYHKISYTNIELCYQASKLDGLLFGGVTRAHWHKCLKIFAIFQLFRYERVPQKNCGKSFLISIYHLNLILFLVLKWAYLAIGTFDFGSYAIEPTN